MEPGGSDSDWGGPEVGPRNLHCNRQPRHSSGGLEIHIVRGVTVPRPRHPELPHSTHPGLWHLSSSAMKLQVFGKDSRIAFVLELASLLTVLGRWPFSVPFEMCRKVPAASVEGLVGGVSPGLTSVSLRFLLLHSKPQNSLSDIMQCPRIKSES